MIKKLLVLSLVFALIAPAIALACVCCGHAAHPASGISIAPMPSHCCPTPTLGKSQERCGMELSQTASMIFQNESGSQIKSNPVFTGMTKISNPERSPDLLGPPVSSRVPAYLSLHTFRI